jgi:hypothetical protein
VGIKLANNASSALDSGISDSDLEVDLPSGDGAKFPSLSAGDYFYASIVEGATIEIVKVTAISSDTFTIVRAQDGTLASAFNASAKFEMRWNVAQVEELIQSRLSGNAIISAKTSNFNVEDDEETTLYLLNGSSAAIVATLPEITSSIFNKTYFFKCVDITNAVSLARSSPDTIDGETSFVFHGKYSVRIKATENFSWIIV